MFPIWAPGSSGGYLIQKSLRLRASNSAYLTRTPGVTGNRTTWTLSFWVRRGTLGTAQGILCGGTTLSDTGCMAMGFYNDTFLIGGYTTNWRWTNRLFRDPNAWYHIVIVSDTTNAIAQNRLRIFVNGIEETSFSVNSTITQNSTPGINQTAAHVIGYQSAAMGWTYADLRLAKFEFIDGLALDPSYFGISDPKTFLWNPIKYAGVYGTNGYFLDFSDNSAATAAAIGADRSGNGNNWTPTGISITNDYTNDSLTDVPTEYGRDTGVGGQLHANYCTLNYLDKSTSQGILTAGNLDWTTTYSINYAPIRGSHCVSSGKYGYEVTNYAAAGSNNNWIFGFTKDTTYLQGRYWSAGSFPVIGAYCPYPSGSVINKISDAITSTAIGALTWTTGDTYQVLADFDNGKYWIGKGGNYYNAANTLTTYDASSPTGTFTPGATYYPYFESTASSDNVNRSGLRVNFGQRPFIYALPSDFKTICSLNVLAEPSIYTPDDYFTIKQYVGNGGRNLVGVLSKQSNNINITKSLRFRAGAAAYLYRTPGVAGNRTTWTYATWVKRGTLNTHQLLFNGGATAGSDTGWSGIWFYATNNALVVGGAATTWLITTRQYFETSHWYHVVVAVDTTQATAANRIRLYVDGLEQKNFATYVMPAQNAQLGINQAALHEIGYQSAVEGFAYADFYLADTYFIDGQQLTPSSFGSFNTEGFWSADSYSGSYGTTGFHLNYIGDGSASATGIGKDAAGSNNWTPTGLSVTAGPSNDSLYDSPTDCGTDNGNGGEVSGNYATLSTGLIAGSYGTLGIANGNLDVLSSANYRVYCPVPITSNMPKLYCEIQLPASIYGGGYPMFGVWRSGGWQTGAYPGHVAASGSSYFNTGVTVTDSVAGPTYTTFAANAIIGMALDPATRQIWIRINGTWVNSGNPAANTGSVFSVAGTELMFFGAGSYSTVLNWNFGQRPFTYAAPSGFKCLCSANYPTISDTAKWWKGKFPDLIYTKNRSGATGWLMSNYQRDNFNLFTATEGSAGEYGSGYTELSKNSIQVPWTVNLNTATNIYVNYMWRKGAAQGIDIVNVPVASASAINHSLGVKPEFIMIKAYTTGYWYITHKDLGTNMQDYYLSLNTYAAASTSAGIWGGEPTSSVFYAANGIMVSGNPYFAILFASVPGFSKVGSYTGNGSADGAFIYCGFRPRFILIKEATGTNAATSYWLEHDLDREGYNQESRTLYPALAQAEATVTTTYGLDALSNGFKMRSTHQYWNEGGGKYVYVAFAQSPFKYSRGS